MQNHSFTKKRRTLARASIRGVLTALLFGALLWTTGVKAAALSGTYTIGSSGNYTTFAAAVSALSSNGISGAVVFNVAAGTYSESVQIPSITGASATNTITFQGAGRGKSIITSSSQTVYFENGCSYVTFNGFTIANSSSGYAVYAYYCNYCSVINCNCPVSSTGGGYAVYDYYTNHLTIQGCYLSGGYYCVYIYSSGGSSTYANATYKNNRITGFGYYAFYTYYTNSNQYIGNVIDSSANGYGYGFFDIVGTGVNFTNNQIIAPGLYYAVYADEINYYNQNTTYQVVNNLMANYQDYFLVFVYDGGNIKIAHNTCISNLYPIYMETEYAYSGIVIADNIFYSTGSNYAAYFYDYSSSPSFPAFYAMLDGNDYYTAGGTLVGTSSGSYGTLAAWQKFCASYTYTNPYNGTKNPMEGYSSNVLPTFVNAAKNNYHVVQTVTQPSGVYAGVNVDIDGDARCKLFPTAGIDESNFGKSKPTVAFYLPTNIYPNSPTTIYQTGKAGEPKVHYWYLANSTYGSLTLISNSVNLTTSAFTVGTNTLKLVTKTCGGNDSMTKVFTVTAPTSVPGTDFIANVNSIQQGSSVNFTDLSTYGPTKWLWSVSPDSAYFQGTKVATTNQYNSGLNTQQNPTIQFTQSGYFKICLTAYNSVGKGATVCKTNYINVVPAVNLGKTPQTLSTPSGYLFDNGGPNAAYSTIASPYIESATISPCADSVYMTFSQFDLYCGYDYLRIYSGKDKTGKPLWGTCGSSGSYSGYGPGFTGGTVWSCSYACEPNVTKPDTFKAGPSMYLEMVNYIGDNSQGFSAYWWSKPRTDKPVPPTFTTSGHGDSVCVNQTLNFTNTTKIDPNDVPTFQWDLDGDFTDGFECVGSCATALWPYFLPGPVTVTLIATNCGGPDTATRTITAYNPPLPKAAFSADNTTPTTNDIIYFSSNVVACVDDYKWTISKTTTGSSFNVTYLNGTSNQAQNPQVNISDTGYFNVKLYIDNASGAHKDSITKVKYLDVRGAYCTPSVATRVAGIGMTGVAINTINNTMPQAKQDYINYVPDQALSTNLAIGATYKLTVQRDASTLFDPINRDVWIDWNQDGSFSGNETVLKDSNSTSQSYTAKVVVPKTAKLGATVMRVATNLNIYPNLPCGQNQFGAYQDYRIYVTPYNILPVITLKGINTLKDTIKVEQGYPYTEPGDSASSYLYGNITKNIVVSSKPVFNAVVPGTYVFAYNVTDSAGNKAITQYRVVEITGDKTAPKLIVATPDTTYIEVTKTPLHPVPVPAVISAVDLVDGNLYTAVTIDSSIVQTNIVGTYTVAYTVSDLSNNTATVYRTIIVIDTIKPVLTMKGTNPDTIEVYSQYVDAGVTPSDVYYTQAQLNPLVTVSSNVDTAVLGTYYVNYNLTDPSKNVAVQATRTVVVVDKIAPVVTLNGPTVDSVAVFQQYIDPGVTYSDNYNKNSELTLTRTGTFVSSFGTKNPNITGNAYTIIYTVTDKSGNKGVVTRIVKVQDRTAPVISLKGPSTVTICRWAIYTDSGYNVHDNYNTVAQLTIDTIGNFYSNGGSTMYGYFSIGYTATDKAGNTSFSGYRYIQVLHQSDFVCQSGIAPELSLDKAITVFPNPNNGMFTINANLPSTQKVRMSVTNMVGQEIAVIHDGVMGQNSFQVDLGTQASGVYLLNIVSGNETVVKRIVIAR